MFVALSFMTDTSVLLRKHRRVRDWPVV